MLFRRLGRDSDAARVLEWWAGTEAVDGQLNEAARIIDEALPLAIGGLEMWTSRPRSRYAGLIGEREHTIPLIRRALFLAGETAHPALLPLAVSYLALVAVETDAAEAARLIAYADALLSAGTNSLKWSAERSRNCGPRSGTR